MSCLLCSHRRRGLADVVPALPSSPSSSAKQSVLTEQSLSSMLSFASLEGGQQQQQQQHHAEFQQSQPIRTGASGASTRAQGVDDGAASTTPPSIIRASIATETGTTERAASKARPTDAGTTNSNSTSSTPSNPTSEHRAPTCTPFKKATKSYVRPGQPLPAPYDYQPLLGTSEEETAPLLELDYPTADRYNMGLVRVPVVGDGTNGGRTANTCGVATGRKGGARQKKKRRTVAAAARSCRIGKPVRRTVGLSILWHWDWPSPWAYDVGADGVGDAAVGPGGSIAASDAPTTRNSANSAEWDSAASVGGTSVFGSGGVPGATVGFGREFPLDGVVYDEDEFVTDNDGGDSGEEDEGLVFTPVRYEFADFDGVEATEALEAAAAAAAKQMGPAQAVPPPPYVTSISLSPD